MKTFWYNGKEYELRFGITFIPENDGTLWTVTRWCTGSLSIHLPIGDINIQYPIEIKKK